eukprot:1041125-Pelagomonas_calceolata.AAC.1
MESQSFCTNEFAEDFSSSHLLLAANGLHNVHGFRLKIRSGEPFGFESACGGCQVSSLGTLEIISLLPSTKAQQQKIN